MHMSCEDEYVDIKVFANYAIIYLNDGIVSIMGTLYVCGCGMGDLHALKFHFKVFFCFVLF